tara:strand:+ start:676 stop:933 length:258 start_codon:yes stop_codon:yes gene_type:complete
MDDEADKLLLKTVGATVTKVALFICIAIASISFFHSCKLDKETMSECKSVCGSSGGIKEVTYSKCICNDSQMQINSSDAWVLPRK